MSDDQTINEYVSRDARTVTVHHCTRQETLLLPSGGTTYGKDLRLRKPKYNFPLTRDPLPKL